MLPASSDYRNGLGDRIPVLHVVSEQFYEHRKANMDAITTHQRGCTHARSELLVLRRSQHNNFTDLPQFSPVVTRLMRAAGAIDPLYAERAIAEVSSAFVTNDRSIHDVQTQFQDLIQV